MILAALYHDIGYVRGVCAGDRLQAFVIDAQGVEIERGRHAATPSPPPSGRPVLSSSP